MRLSARNQIPATVTGITMGEATANIALDAGGVRLVASITVEAARELGLAEGTQVTAVIKASDVIVAVQLSPGGGRPPVPPDVGAGRPETSLKSRRPRPGWILSLRGRPLSLSDGDYLPIGHGH
jgi:molybdopterin-binding protein